ncbi:putative hydroxypyruvate isomerase [Uloborus diversus]|uniref:putative hydroxypyruvate isomerase n=1 Tax=Uloborus diversus TaxID=327109 RepID=UPI00240A7D62|nr:putative hydroxypyruvate isomerase [Uloborus diversus]
MRFAANLSTMFPNLPMPDRYSAAAGLGFKAVECQFVNLTENTPDELKEAMKNAGIEHHVLLNSWPGDNNEFGFAALPGGEEPFFDSISKVLPYTFSLGCRKLHILSGLVQDDCKNTKFLEDMYVGRMQVAAEVLEDHAIVGLIEPLSPRVKNNYFLSSFEKAIELLEKIQRPNIKLLLDIFHLQEIEESMENLEKYYKYAGHIQVSQSPDRREPGAQGRIDYEDVFERLKKLGHNDYIGLEYYPQNSVEESLNWLKKFGSL